jgi:hypothetical protein
MSHHIESDQRASQEQKLLQILIEEVRLALEKTELAIARSRREGNANDVEQADAIKK